MDEASENAPCDARVLAGDCLDRLREVSPRSVDLVYLDPPFFTGKTHRLKTRDRTREFSFDDLWSSQEDYARFLHERLVALRRVLAETGSLFFHCDRRATHIARALLDGVFGAQRFRSEIIWHYRRWSNSKSGLIPSHQTILYTTRSRRFTFNRIYQGYSPSTNVDQIMQKRRRDADGRSVYATDPGGRAVSQGAKAGVPLADVWDIPYLNPKARERTGYPTQKPVLLLERVVELASNPGDLVLDPFCGSGTTLVAARLLGRRALGMDISPEAVAITEGRLRNPIKTTSRVLTEGRGSYATADAESLALLGGLALFPVHRNKGIDAILHREHGARPVLVRVQRKGEPLEHAGWLLKQAARARDAAALILVAIEARGEDALASAPEGVTVVDSTALAVRQHLLAIAGGASGGSKDVRSELHDLDRLARGAEPAELPAAVDARASRPRA